MAVTTFKRILVKTAVDFHYQKSISNLETYFSEWLSVFYFYFGYNSGNSQSLSHAEDQAVRTSVKSLMLDPRFLGSNT